MTATAHSTTSASTGRQQFLDAYEREHANKNRANEHDGQRPEVERGGRLANPVGHTKVSLPPRGFGPFVWACSHGLRRYIALMTLLTAAIGVFEALLFAMLGRIVDWLGPLQPGRLWAEHGAAKQESHVEAEDGEDRGEGGPQPVLGDDPGLG